MNGPKGMPSNSIVDSGTNSLNLPPQMLKAVISKFSSAQQTLLTQSILDNKLVCAADVQTGWPTLTFILQGNTADVSQVAPSDYLQVNTLKVGAAVSAITKGVRGFRFLGCR
ncbi:MAG TPA: hypothetical protein VIX90_12140 [Edaphobacter sp.]